MAKKKTSGNTHATMSFEQLVANATWGKIRPEVEVLFEHFGDELSKRVFRQLAAIQTRIMAVENLLIAKAGLTMDEIENEVAAVEDTATGYRAVIRTAQAGDLVRATFSVKPKDSEVWSNPTKRLISSLQSVPSALGSPSTEEAMVGMATGEKKVITTTEGVKISVTIDRISEKVPQEVPSENPNA